jgi:hypothetical protein
MSSRFFNTVHSSVGVRVLSIVCPRDGNRQLPHGPSSWLCKSIALHLLKTVMSKEYASSRSDYITALALSRIRAENLGRLYPHPKPDKPKRLQPSLIPDLRFEPTYLARLAVAGPDWQSVVWITLQDQVINPLIQGALWCVACHLLEPT